WWRELPLSTASVEFIGCVAYPPLVACAVQFLLSHAALRSRIIEGSLVVQCLLMPLSMLIAGPTRVFLVANAWYSLLALEVFAVMGLYLAMIWKRRRVDFGPMLFILTGIAFVLLLEMAVQLQVVPQPPIPLTHFALPVLFIAV